MNVDQHVHIPATSTHPVTPARAEPVRRQLSQVLRRLLVSVVALVALSAGAVLAAAPAQASVVHCGSGRCTVYLSQSETRAMAHGSVPAASSVPGGPLRTAYYALVYGHRWFASQYAKRGWCSAFTLDIRPWARQGYWGYACTWR